MPREGEPLTLSFCAVLCLSFRCRRARLSLFTFTLVGLPFSSSSSPPNSSSVLRPSSTPLRVHSSMFQSCITIFLHQRRWRDIPLAEAHAASFNLQFDPCQMNTLTKTKNVEMKCSCFYDCNIGWLPPPFLSLLYHHPSPLIATLFFFQVTSICHFSQLHFILHFNSSSMQAPPLFFFTNLFSLPLLIHLYNSDFSHYRLFNNFIFFCQIKTLLGKIATTPHTYYAP